jgi:hypothetical protein
VWTLSSGPTKTRDRQMASSLVSHISDVNEPTKSKCSLAARINSLFEGSVLLGRVGFNIYIGTGISSCKSFGFSKIWPQPNTLIIGRIAVCLD